MDEIRMTGMDKKGEEEIADMIREEMEKYLQFWVEMLQGATH